ncbi:MAG TPA: type II toxin-antitoxin system VapB family antitoxin [Oligoflexia bacterium]|nr:type II toxin-antitoxin system VapB family antitoxin [Oligoflexia bacterium]HMP48760.1 type II toxin-antitoxin system VapB family antitoxin [Oligoflexia bacterium]
MRTNIVLNEKLISECLKESGIRTKKELVDEALKMFLMVKKQGKIKNYRGKLSWDGNLEKERARK